MKAPAYQMYAAEYLADERVTIMSLEAEGAYIRLLNYCWREGTIPANPIQLSRLCKGASVEIIEEVIPCFYPDPNQPGRLLHKRLEAEREKQELHRLKQAENGKRGGRPPKPNDNPNDKPTETQNKAVGYFGETQTEPKKSSSSSSSFSTINKDTINTEALPPVVPSKAEVSLKSVLPEIKTDPVPKPDKPATFEDKYAYFIQIMNELMGRKFKGCAPSKSNLKARLKEGYTSKDFKKAIENCLADPYHKANPNYLTPEFITRPDKLERYLNAVPIPEEFIETGAGIVKHTDEELENRFGEKREGFVQRDYTQPGFKPLLKAV